MATSIITRGSNPKLEVPGIKDIFGLTYAQYQPQWKPLFTPDVSGRAYEEDVGMSSMGLGVVKPEGEPLTYDTQKQTYVARYTNVSISLGFIITREEIQDNQYAKVGAERAECMAFSMNQAKEYIAANIFNRAFSNTYPGGDAVSLINASHPTEAGLLSNTLTVAQDLSEAALEEALIDISLFKDDRGKIIGLLPECLAIPPQLLYDATRILKNPQRPDTANRDINAMYTLNSLPSGVIKNQFFTDSDAWFILTNCPVGLKYYERSPATIEQDNEFNTKNKMFSSFERYSFGWSDWRRAFGSQGA